MKRDLYFRLVLYISALVLAAFTLFPIAWVLSSSLKTRETVLAIPPKWIPNPVTFESYIYLFTEKHFARIIANSFVVCGSTTLLSLFIGAMAAYALARLKMRFKNVIFMLMFAPYVFPSHLLIGPLFLIFKSLGWINTYQALIIPYLNFSLPLAIWLLTAYINGIPRELDDAARVDGCSDFQILLRVIFPLLRPGLAAAGLLVFMGSWVEFMYALTFTTDERAQTIPVVIGTFQGRYHLDWAGMSAASITAIIPLAAIIMIFQRYFVRGVVQGAVRG